MAVIREADFGSDQGQHMLGETDLLQSFGHQPFTVML
jgi:hypothetical protein